MRCIKELYAEDLKRDVEREVQKEVQKEVQRSFALIGKLLREDRIDDIRKVSEDKAYRDMMYRQYGL